MLFRTLSASTGGPRKQTLCQQLQPSYSLPASVCSAGFSARIGLFAIGSSVYLFPSVWTKMFCIQNFSLKLRWYFPQYLAESSKSVWWAFQIYYHCMAFQTRLWLCPFCFCPGPEVMLRPDISKMLLCAQGVLLVFSCGSAWWACKQSISQPLWSGGSSNILNLLN